MDDSVVALGVVGVLAAVALLLDWLAGRGKKEEPTWHLYLVKKDHPLTKEKTDDIRRLSDVTVTRGAPPGLRRRRRRGR